MASVERSTQDIDQPRRTSSTSTKQPSLATMTIKDADQSNKNPHVAGELNMLRQLSIDDFIQSQNKSEDETSGRVDPIPANIIVRGATGNKLTSGFSDPAFGQIATPIKNSSCFTNGRISKLDTISSNAPSFGDLAISGGTVFGPSFRNLPFGTSNPSIGSFGTGIRSDAEKRNISAESSIKTKSSRLADDGNSENPKQRGDKSLGEEYPRAIDQASTTSSTSSNQRLSTRMSIDDEDKSTNNNTAAEPFDVTILSNVIDDENFQAPKQREENDSGQVDLTTPHGDTGHGFKFGQTSGFSEPVFGHTSIPSQHSRFTSGYIPKFDILASDAPSFGDLAQSEGTPFANDTSFAALQLGTSYQPNKVVRSEKISDADRFTNYKTTQAPNKTLPSNLINDGNYQNVKQSTIGTPSEFCRPVLGPIAASKNDSRSHGNDGIRSKDNVRQNVFASPKDFSNTTRQNNDLFGNQGAQRFRSTGSSQTASFSGGKFSSESIRGVGCVGFGILQHQKQPTSVIGQMNTSSISSMQRLSESMSVDDAVQLNNNNPTAESFGTTIQRDLTNDEKSKTPNQQADDYYGQVNPTTNTTTTLRASGLTSGFVQPFFGLAATPHQHSRSDGGDEIRSKDNVLQNVFASPKDFSNTTRHNNDLFGNQGAQSFRSTGSSQTASFSGGKFSGESIGGVGYVGFGISQHQEQPSSVIGQMNTTSSISSMQRLCESMSVDDAVQLNNNNPTAESFGTTIQRDLTNDEKSKTPNQQADDYYGQVDPTTNTSTTLRASGLTSGFVQPFFGLAATPHQHSRFTSGCTPKFDNLASVAPSFGDLAQLDGTPFDNDTSFVTLQLGTSYQPNKVFRSEVISDADRFTNYKIVQAPNNTLPSNLINEGNYQNAKQSTLGIPSEFCRPVLGPSTASKNDSSSSRTYGDDGIRSKDNVRQNVFASSKVFSNTTRQNNDLFGNQGAQSFRSTGSSQTASLTDGKFSGESIGGVGYVGFGISQHHKQPTSVIGQMNTTSSISSMQRLCESMSVDDAVQLNNNNPTAESFGTTIQRDLTNDEKSKTPNQQADDYYGQVDPTTNTTTTLRANGLTSGFVQPFFGLAATPHQHSSSGSIPIFDSLVQASDWPSFGDLTQSCESTFGSDSSFVTPTCGTSEPENPSGSEGSTLRTGPSFTDYRS